MEPWNLVLEHKYSEAVSAYDKALEATPNDRLAIAARATALLCMGRLEEAKADFQRASGLDIERSGGESSGYPDELAVTHWLLGERGEAIGVLRDVIDGLRAGRVQYADTAGGASHGLLLWYMALVAKDQKVLRCALEFLDELSTNRPLSICRPGVLALFALGRSEFGDVLYAIGETRMLGRIERRARKDLYARRELCKAKFYLGAKHLESGEEAEYRKQLIECAALENPILDPEWYIARAVTENT